ncbi:MAG: hypothetical protein M0Z46_01170 [Actinomycetota bacterium]|nr:hypothetical protein [Actinomycetota bacterium]
MSVSLLPAVHPLPELLSPDMATVQLLAAAPVAPNAILGWPPEVTAIVGALGGVCTIVPFFAVDGENVT